MKVNINIPKTFPHISSQNLRGMFKKIYPYCNIKTVKITIISFFIKNIISVNNSYFSYIYILLRLKITWGENCLVIKKWLGFILKQNIICDLDISCWFSWDSSFGISAFRRSLHVALSQYFPVLQDVSVWYHEQKEELRNN